MFISLSSTTRTRTGRSVMASRLFRCCRRRCRRRCLGCLGEELRIEVDLRRFPHLLDFVQRGLLLHATGDGGADLIERLRRMRADLEDMDAVARRNGIADLSRLELRHVRLDLRREHARAEWAENAALF